ncbi:MAG TPA: hypothetical protein VLI54_01005 [Bacillota bacterium]|nr:hypothetical protein [Bacillota bacterium]
MTSEPYPHHPEFSGDLDAVPATADTKREVQKVIAAKAAGGMPLSPTEDSITQVYEFPGQPARGNFGVTLCGRDGWDGRLDVVGHVGQTIPGEAGSIACNYTLTRQSDPYDPYGLEVTHSLHDEPPLGVTAAERREYIEHLGSLVEASVTAAEEERAMGLPAASEQQAQNLLRLLNDPSAQLSPRL